MKDIVATTLGTVVQQVHDDVGESDRLFAYFDSYGRAPTSTDSVDLVMNKFPKYPTNNVVEVEVERLNAAWLVTRARWVDTSNPEEPFGEWHDLEELDQ